ncbi:hypothetical protein ACFLR1_01750, partial [Bacteroidota bacterium]
MKNPETMDAQSVTELRSLVKRYPYFQAAQMMLAKNLKQENNIGQLDQLHLAAVVVPDRKVFHAYMNDRQKQQPIVKADEISKELVSPVDIKTTEETEAPIEQIFPDDLIPEPIIYQLETAILPDLPVIEPVLEVPQEDQPEIELEPKELSFAEWLEYTQTGKVEKEDVKPVSKFEKAAPQVD